MVLEIKDEFCTLKESSSSTQSDSSLSSINVLTNVPFVIYFTISYINSLSLRFRGLFISLK